MRLQVDQEKKTKYQKNIARSKKSVRIIMTIAKVLLFVGIIGGGAYAILNFIVPSLSIVNVNGVLQKDVGWIIISTSFIVAPCLISSVCLKALANNLAGVTNSSRVDESILIADGCIRYSFRQKHQSLSSERIVLTINFCEIDSIDFDEDTNLLRISGKILSEYYDDYKKEKPVETNILNGFVICDYFSPSLKEILLEEGIHVEIKKDYDTDVEF